MPTIQPLLTAEEIRSLYRRACAVMDAWDAREDDDHVGYEADHRSAIDALRLCVTAAAQLEDPKLLGLIIHACSRVDTHETYGGSGIMFSTATAHALEHALSFSKPSEEVLRSVAEHELVPYRLAVAKGLQPSTPHAVETLRRLTIDTSPDVRKAAKKALSTLQSVSWWSGKWRTDPLQRLTPDEAEKHEETLRRLDKLLDKNWLDEEERVVRVDLLRSLPLAIALEPAEVVWTSQHDVATGTFLLEYDDGIEPLLRGLLVWTREEYGYGRWSLRDALKALPVTRRLEVLKPLIAYVCAHPSGLAGEPRSTGTIATISSAIEESWPLEVEITPVVDALLALGPNVENAREDGLLWLNSLLRKAVIVPDALARRVADARRQGWPEGWARLQSVDLLDRASPDILRSAAEEATHRDDPAEQHWGWRLLLGRLHQASSDPPRCDLAERLVHDRKTRSMMIENLATHALPMLRDELRRGLLTLIEATHVIKAIGSLWDEDNADDDFASSLDDRTQLGELLGETSWQGPLTKEERQRIRELRDHTFATGDSKARILSLSTLSDGPWDEDDVHLRDDLLARLRARTEGAIGEAVCVLTRKPDALLVAAMAALDGQIQPDGKPIKITYFVRLAQKLLANPTTPAMDIWLEVADEELDTPDKSANAAKADPSGEKAWMDQDD